MRGALRRFVAEFGFAVVAALVTAALHLLTVAVRREVFGTYQWDWNTRDAALMIPAGYAMVFAVCALPLAFIAMVRRAGLPARARVWFWSALVAFSVLLLFTRVHSIAWLLLALGVGYQTTAWAVGHPRGWNRLVRGVGITLGVGFAAGAALLAGRRAGQERTMLAALADAPASAPNVLLIIWDTVRAQNMSLYGYGRPTTPFLDSLAAHAVVFEHAYATAPWTLPSHASMLTGQYASAQSGGWTTPLDGTHRALSEALYTQGYATGAFVANLIYGGYEFGLHRGFAHYDDYKRSLPEAWESTTLTQSRALRLAYQRIVREHWFRQALVELLRFDWRPREPRQLHAQKSAESVTGAFLRWEKSVRHPYFAMLNYMEAHGGHTAPSAKIFNEGALREDVYDGAIWWLDREVRKLVAELERRGELERTILIVTADHGEQFGEHDLIAHANSLYSTVLRVPLVMYAPGRLPGGVRVTREVSLRDLARTVQQLAGASTNELPGESLAPLTTNPQAASSPVVAELAKALNLGPRNRNYWGPMTAVFDDTLHVIRDGQGKIEAYAYRTDISETDDLARDPARHEVLERLLRQTVRSAGLAY